MLTVRLSGMEVECGTVQEAAELMSHLRNGHAVMSDAQVADPVAKPRGRRKKRAGTSNLKRIWGAAALYAERHHVSKREAKAALEDNPSLRERWVAKYDGQVQT